MKIKPEIIQKINTPINRVAIAYELGITEQSVIKAIGRNTPNGTLTTLSSLKAISKIVGEENLENLLEEPTTEHA